jgi:hypothetical protein
MKFLAPLVVLVAVPLSACGIAQRMQAQEQAKQVAAHNAELAAQSATAVTDCNAKLPAGNPKTAVARMQCLNDAIMIRMSTFGPDQDLAQVWLAERMVVAERIQTGKMTIAEGNAAIAEKWSQAVSESQRRHNATQSVIAQQNAAAAQQDAAAAANTAAWASVMQATRPSTPVTCVHTGNMTTCN